MYSIFYHRYVADLLMYTYYLCSLKNISIYNKVTHKRLSDSLLFLSQLIFNHKGHTPNLGANDGANPFSIFSTDYRDFRESLSLMALILENRTLSDSPYSPFNQQATKYLAQNIRINCRYASRRNLLRAVWNLY